MSNLSLMISDMKYNLMDLYKLIKNGGRNKIKLKSRVSVSKIKGLLRKRGLAMNEKGRPSWFYTAYHRGDSDPLTNNTLDFICKKIPKDADILITGCGTGITLFFLMDQGFKNVEGFDFLNECVLIANDIARLGGYTTKIWRDDGFNPSLTKKYDLITAMHWVFSAWMGNYGNDSFPLQDAKSLETRERLLLEFLSKYSPHLHPGGRLIVELTDAVADYRLPEDREVKGVPLDTIYPVRHTPEQVSRCAERCGLEVVSYNMCCSYGHQPRTRYILMK